MKKTTRRKRQRSSVVLILILLLCITGAVMALCARLFSFQINKNEPSKPEQETLMNIQNQNHQAGKEHSLPDDYDISLSDNDSPYLIRVNRAANCVTVYAKDKAGHYTIPIKAIVCSTGKNVGDTPLGTFSTTEKYDWRLMVDGTYSQYAYRIHDEIMFHSVPCFDRAKDELECEEYNKLGQAASLGCIRMSVRDSKWLYDNCPEGTTVVIYDDADNPGPLGKPEAIHIPEDSLYSGWDPTDPDPNNPWLTSSPVITGAVDLTVKTGSSINLLKHICAIDTCGNDISDKVGITGNYDLNTPGIYSVTYTVTDLIGKTTAVTVNITVTNQDIEIIPSEPVTAVRETTYQNHDRYTSDWNENQNYDTEPPVTTSVETTAYYEPVTELPTEPIPTDAWTKPPETEHITQKPKETEEPTTKKPKETEKQTEEEQTKKKEQSEPKEE